MQTSLHHWINLIHYSRILISLLAMSLTTSCSMILTGWIEWDAVIIVGLGTYVIYNIDNLLDWNHEDPKPNLNGAWERSYFFLCLLTIPPASFYASAILINSRFDSLLLLGTLTLISLLHILVTRKPSRATGILVWIEPITVSIIWTLVIVLMLVSLGRVPFSVQMGRAFVFVWELCFIGVLIRQLSLTTGEFGSQVQQSTAQTISASNLVKVIGLVSILMFLMVAYDTYIQLFPWYNAFLLVVPLSLFMFAATWHRFRERPILFEICFYLLGISGAILISTIYYFGGRL
jgi:hypothetical protein